jgi:hypothetical protein
MQTSSTATGVAELSVAVSELASPIAAPAPRTPAAVPHANSVPVNPPAASSTNRSVEEI